MIPVKSIKLDRAEGPVELCYAVTVANWSAAEATLNRWALTAPKRGYDKIDFTVTFEDGLEYEGRYDLCQDRSYQDNPTLAGHIRDFCRFYSGQAADNPPGEWTKEEYQVAVSRLPEETRAFYAKILAEYDVQQTIWRRFTEMLPDLSRDFLLRYPDGKVITVHREIEAKYRALYGSRTVGEWSYGAL